jgi:hypothetical protein
LNPVRVVNLSSKILVAIALAYIPLALAEAGLRRPIAHAVLMAEGFLPAFVAGIAISYAASPLTFRRAYSASARLALLSLTGGLLALALASPAP